MGGGEAGLDGVIDLGKGVEPLFPRQLVKPERENVLGGGGHAGGVAFVLGEDQGLRRS